MAEALDLKQLHTFQAVVRQGSFARAAEELGIAQSTVTLHVQALESQFSTPLFTRLGRRAELTDAGRILHERAEALLRDAAALQVTMDDFGAGMSGNVRIGAIESAASILVLPVLVRFIKQRPRVQLRVEVGGTSSLRDRVLSGDLDIALCSPPGDPGLLFEHLFDERFVLLLPEQHPLAEKTRISVEDLSSTRLLVSEPNCEYRGRVEAALLSSGTQPYSGIEIGTIVGLKRAVQAGFGAAILPIAPVTPTPAGTVVRELEGVDIRLPIGMVQRRETGFASPALRELAERIRSALSAPVEELLAAAAN